MYRIDVSSAASALPAPAALATEGYWQAGNPAAGTPATLLDQDWFNALQESLVAVLAAAGVSRSKTDYTRLTTAIKALISGQSGQTTLASASAVAIGAAATFSVIITGTTAIAAFDTVPAGLLRLVRFSAALTLTHNATALALPGGQSITTAAGDIALLESQGGGNWRCLVYQRASGAAVANAAIGAAGSYDSGQQSITVGGVTSLTHGLGTRPRLVCVFVACVTAEGNYAAGDEVQILGNGNIAGDATAVSHPRGIMTVASATGITVIIGSSGIEVFDKTGGTAVAITPGNWRFIVRAYA